MLAFMAIVGLVIGFDIIDTSAILGGVSIACNGAVLGALFADWTHELK